MLPPPLAFGLLSRGISIVYAISFLSIATQIRSLAGATGISPFSSALRQIRHDLPRSFWSEYPSLFWLTGASDLALVLVPLAGAACAVAAALGAQTALVGECTLFCWLAMRTLDLPIGRGTRILDCDGRGW